jgi:PhnB protein
MKLTPQFSFNGNCAEAMAFYAKTLGGTVKFETTWGESPMCKDVPEHWQGKLMHATLDLGESLIFGCDPPPDKFRAAAGTATGIAAKTLEEGQRIFDALAHEGVIGMPFQKTFWSPGFGFVTDRFGIPWMVNTDSAEQR